MKPLRGILILLLLVTLGFSLGAILQPIALSFPGRAEAQSRSIIETLLGNSRELFARQFSTRADMYFHSAYYPSIFDEARKAEEQENAVAHGGEHEVKGEEEGGFLGQPTDWIDRFGRNFKPVVHTHLAGTDVREILPWLKISAALDPHQIDNYTTAAYWLSEQLGKVDEAEDFLRDGLKANPGNAELLYELGNLLFKHRNDLVRSHNLFVAALKRWHESEDAKKEEDQDRQVLRKILGGLAEVEIKSNHFDRAAEYLTQLKGVSPNPEEIQQQIDALRGGKVLEPHL